MVSSANNRGTRVCKAPTGFSVWPLALAASYADRASVKADHEV